MNKIWSKAPFVGHLLNSIEIYDGLRVDYFSFGENTTKAMAKVGGSAIGSENESYCGAIVCLIYSGGTLSVPLSILGGIIGSYIGGLVGELAGEEFYKNVHY